jgi:hypothetical protein
MAPLSSQDVDTTLYQQQTPNYDNEPIFPTDGSAYVWDLPILPGVSASPPSVTAFRLTDGNQAVVTTLPLKHSRSFCISIGSKYGVTSQGEEVVLEASQEYPIFFRSSVSLPTTPSTTSAYPTFLSTDSDSSHHAASPTPEYRLEMTVISLGYPDFQVIDEPHENGKMSPIKIGDIVIFNCDPSWRYEVMGLAKFTVEGHLTYSSMLHSPTCSQELPETSFHYLRTT